MRAIASTVRSAPSRIDGIGAFAMQPLPRRRKVGEVMGRQLSVRAARRLARGLARVHIVELDDSVALDLSASDSPLKFLNHSCDPNCYLRIAYGRLEVYAIRDIAPGEELTADYGETHHDGTLQCRCASPGCRRFL